MAFLRRVRDERRISARRSLTSTVPGVAVVPPSASRAWLADRPSWCVDRGETIEALTTCDLWLALARGDVTPQTKVWREGMPYWDHVASVPEFALAMPDASVWEPPPGRTAAAPETAPVSAVRPVATSEDRDASSPGRAESFADRTGDSVVESTTMSPPADLGTPAPVVVEDIDEKETVRPPSRTRRRAFPRIDRAGALSVAIGATLAVLALAFATTGPAPGGPGPRFGSPIAEHAAAGAPVRGAPLPLPAIRDKHEEPAGSPAGSTSARESAATDSKIPPAHAADRGQRRARAGTTDPRR